MAYTKLKTLHGIDIYVSDAGRFRADIPGYGHKESIKIGEIEKAIEKAQPEGELNLWTQPSTALISDNRYGDKDPAPQTVTIIGIAVKKGSYRGMASTEAYRVRREGFGGAEMEWPVESSYFCIPDPEVAAALHSIREEFKVVKQEYEARLAAEIARLRRVGLDEIKTALRRQALMRQGREQARQEMGGVD